MGEPASKLGARAHQVGPQTGVKRAVTGGGDASHGVERKPDIVAADDIDAPID
jgi:hypothetical protein